MRNQVWDSSFANLNSLHLAEFVFCLSCLNTVDGEAALGIVDQAEVLASLVDRDHIHETSWVCVVRSNFAVDLDEALHQNGSGLTAIEGILQAVSEEDDQGKTITGFLSSSQHFLRRRTTKIETDVRTRRSLGGIGTRQLIQKPVRRRAEAFLMLLWTATHLDCCVDRE